MLRWSCLVVAATAVACTLLATPASARPLSEKVTERVVDSAIDSGLETLTQPDNLRRLGQVLSSPAVTGGVHDIAFSLVDGILDGVEGRVAFDLDFDWKRFDDAARKHVGPAVGTVTRNAVDAALGSALSEANGVRVEAFAAHATHGLMRGLASGLRDELGPALAHVIEHDLAPAGAAALEHHLLPAVSRGIAEPGMQASIAMTMSSVARSLVRGGDAGIETAKAEANAAGEDGAMEIFGNQLSFGLSIAMLVTGGFATLLVLLVVLLVRTSRGQRRFAEEGRRREDDLRVLVERLLTQRADDDDPASQPT
jgi:hypothetical protein